MRRIATGVLAGLMVLALGFSGAPAPAAAATGPKVVLVVGATHGVTPTYRSWMNVVATTAAKYTKNVVKVYSPNATWPAVRNALQGASIVVYMGHGNGFPSPYSTTLNTYTQNGFGLNATAGSGDSNTKYYGERFVASEVDLAPNALVILSHLCYAAGNSEPGRAEPSLSVAKARLDNFAAGFLRAGARAVIADGHDDPSWYITQVFTTERTIEQIWRSGPRPRGNVFTFPSARTSGYTAFSDPDRKSGSTYSGFYRSLVAKPTLTSQQIVAGGYARTDLTPTTFVVPGAAEVTAPEGIGLYADAALTPTEAGTAPATLPAGTRLRLLARPATTSAGVAVFEVATLDGAASGFVLATGLAPRDSVGPRIWELQPSTPAFSPNGDGSRDVVDFTGRASEAVAWRVDVAGADGAVVATLAAEGQDLAVTWDGLVDGSAVPDGRYTATATVTDAWGNPPGSGRVTVTVDTVAPTIDLVAPAAETVPVFTPNGDGVTDEARLAFGADEPGTVSATVRDAEGTTVDTFTAAMPAGIASAAWDGHTSSGAWVTDGRYAITLRPMDVAGNRGGTVTAETVAYGALGWVARSTVAIHARDLDRFASTVKLTYRLLRPATVTWTLTGPAGVTIVRYADRAMPAGSYGWTWNGKLPDGRWAPAGYYTSRVEATDGTTTIAQTAKFHVNAFRVSLSDTTPARGQSVTVTIATTEPLKANPRLAVSQPGRSTVTYSTSRVSSSVYRVTIRLATGGAAGTLGLRVNGYDVDGGYNWSAFSYPLH